MYLIATKYNVGVYWSTNLSVYTPEMHDYLGLGPEDKCLVRQTGVDSSFVRRSDQRLGFV